MKATLRRRLVHAGWQAAFERWAATKPPGSVAVQRFGGQRGAVASRVEPEVTEQISRFWLEPPSRWRVEVDVPGGVAVSVVDGARWWSYAPGIHAYSNEAAPEADPAPSDHPEWPLLHRKEVLRGVVLGSVRAGEQLGRSVELIEAIPDGAPDRRLSVGADAYEFVIDRERGIVVGTAARFRGLEFFRHEIVELDFDRPFGPEVFRLVLPPGVSFTRPKRPRRSLLRRLFRLRTR